MLEIIKRVILANGITTRVMHVYPTRVPHIFVDVNPRAIRGKAMKF